MGFLSSLKAKLLAAGAAISFLLWKLYRRAVGQRDEARRRLEQEQDRARRAEALRKAQERARAEGQVRVEEARERASDPEKPRDHFENQ